MTPIRTTDKAGINGIIQTGKPAGLWIAQSVAFPKIWTGAVADGLRAVRKHGTFGEIVTWLQRKSGILRDERADRVIRDSFDTFRGIRVTLGVTVWIPESEMQRARVYSGFSAGRLPKAKHGTPTAEADGIKHRNSMRNKANLTERDGKIRELVLSGMTAKRVGEALGISAKAAGARITILRKAGELPPYNPKASNRDSARFWTPEEDARIMILYAQGRNALQIAAELQEELHRTEVAIAAHARRLKKRKEGGEGR